MRILMAAMIAGVLAAPAFASEPGYETFSVRVPTADLDLATATGQARLEKRLDVAVGRLCGMPVFFTREELADLQACRDDAMKAAAPQLAAAKARQGISVASTR